MKKGETEWCRSNIWRINGWEIFRIDERYQSTDSENLTNPNKENKKKYKVRYHSKIQEQQR